MGVVAISKCAMAMQMTLHTLNMHELTTEWGLTKGQRAIMGGMMFLGMIGGSSFWGAMSDKFGRKKVFLLTILNTALFGLAASFCGEYYSYMALRFLLGFGMGGMGPVSISLLLEFTPSYCRGYASGMAWIGYYIGEALEVLLGLAFNWGENGAWRDLVMVTSICPLVLLMLWGIGLLDIPESPRYCLISGRQEEGWNILQEAAKQNRSIMFRKKLVNITTSKLWVDCTSSEKRGSVMQ